MNLDYEKRYKEALENASIAYKDEDKHLKATLERIFPELKGKESDERTRKAILTGLIDCRDAPDLGWSDFGGINIDECIAWIEQQGEQTHATLGQLEMTSAQELEPKFNVGDWITNGELTCKVLGVVGKSYELHLYNDDYCHFETDVQSVDEDYHLWTIEDAKDGDVLVTEDGRPFIIRCMVESENDIPSAYCGINARPSEAFVIITGYSPGISRWTNSKVHPATKEQRDLLFQKMKQAGYEWDAENKELNKQTLKITPKFCIDQLITDNNGTWYKITNIKCLDDWYYEVYDIGEDKTYKTYLELCSIIDERFRYVGEIKKQ